MYRLFLICLALLAAGCGERESPAEIKSDEHVVLFRTAAWLNEDTREWHVPIHGWVYEPEDSSARKMIFEELLESQFELSPTDETDANFSRRLNLLIADNERGEELTVNIAGRDFALPPSAENGHFETTLLIPEADVDQFAAGDYLSYSAMISGAEALKYDGEVRLVEPAGLSVISDIDDTVKISNVTDRKRLLEYAFLLDFEAAPGMSGLYRDWSTGDVSFHYVSSSPWQLYEPLTEFLDDDKFPWATLNLKAVRFRDETLLDLFKKGTETKPAIIEKILATYPRREFVLVGDSGEQDPEVYAGLLRKFPDQVKKAYIRNVTQETADNARFTAVFDNIDENRWQLFDDTQDLADARHTE